MQHSGSDVGFNQPSAEESHCPLDPQTFAGQPLVPEHQSFHKPEAPVPMGLDNADSRDSLSFEENPVVKRVCISIPEQEAIVMDSIIRGSFVPSLNEEHPKQISAGPPALSSMQAPKFPRPQAHPLAAPSFNLIAWSEAATLGAPNFASMTADSVALSSGVARELTHAPETLAKETGAKRKLPNTNSLEMAELFSSVPRPSKIGYRQQLNVKHACDRCKFKKSPCNNGKPCEGCKKIQMSTWIKKYEHKYEKGVLLANRCGFDFGKDDFDCLADCFRAMINLCALPKHILLGDAYMNSGKWRGNIRYYFDQMMDEAAESISLVSELGSGSKCCIPYLIALLELQYLGVFYHASKDPPELRLPTLLGIAGKLLNTEPIPWFPVHFLPISTDCQVRVPTIKYLLSESDTLGGSEQGQPPVALSWQLLGPGLFAFWTAQLPMLALRSRSCHEDQDIYDLWSRMHSMLWNDLEDITSNRYPPENVDQPIASLAGLYLICLVLKNKWHSVAWFFGCRLHPSWDESEDLRIPPYQITLPPERPNWGLDFDTSEDDEGEDDELEERTDVLETERAELAVSFWRRNFCHECSRFRFPALLTIYMESIRLEDDAGFGSKTEKKQPRQPRRGVSRSRLKRLS
ncbi:hypothetical protein PG988_001797 [Apiospora saccharicola]